MFDWLQNPTVTFLFGVIVGCLVWAAKPGLARRLPPPKKKDIFWD